ncbi:cobyrinate a,c-diamide synthase [Nakamurella leprariae]|uniref:cobyrinate a,c-diamide synthase n=1 Tax=Nakamurella leprariae TaxID=2803911 RepID=UPI002E2ABC8C|nr:cobyrinate a,c-diamide synthase [Nakamurella leprariae]
MVGTHRLPRLVVSAPASGHGKTTVATGLMAALRRAGHVVSGHKVGPDYIDPGFHALATGRPGRNLDAHLVGEGALVPLLLHGAATPEPAEIAVIEGVMGLYDGAIGREGFASTAHVAAVLRAPIVLVVDISSASRTIAAVVHGLASFDRSVRLAGVILNKAGSPRHAGEVADALEATGVPVLGVLARDDGISAPSRHLGLVPAAELDRARSVVDRLADQITQRVDLAEVVRIAQRAPDLVAEPWSPHAALAASGWAEPAGVEGERPVVAIAGGRAFTFRYPETEELLAAAGLMPMTFDPLTDERLPDGTAGLYLGGGFPEVHAAGLVENRSLLADVAAAVTAGLPTVAECAGLLYLAETLDGTAMVGAVPTAAAMSPRLTLGYRTAVAPVDTVLAAAGTRVTGHEFHRTATTPVAGADPAWLVAGRPIGWSVRFPPGGEPVPLASLHASYLHLHWAGSPQVAARFATAVHDFAGRRWSSVSAEVHRAVPEAAAMAPAIGTADVDLRHHGDAEIETGMLDLAVNVRVPTPPPWLRDRITATVTDLGAYPVRTAAVTALAARHRRPADEVLPTSGGAEAFTLLARAARDVVRSAVIVHPQFTEPEAALRAAGVPVQRLLLEAVDGFRFHAERLDPDADLIVLGNPTNPTGTLHRADVIAALLRPGRLVVVDEAFMDAVADEPESLAERRLTGLVVLRSLTKTWGLAGLRAGYALGDPTWIAAMAAQQPPWSVSSPALAAIEACSTAEATVEATAAAHRFSRDREMLVRGLGELGLTVAGTPATPFVLVDTAGLRPATAAPGWLREQLRGRGFAVRRGDTFPGLGPDWIRIAVRDAATSRRLLAAIAAVQDRGAVDRSVMPPTTAARAAAPAATSD